MKDGYCTVCNFTSPYAHYVGCPTLPKIEPIMTRQQAIDEAVRRVYIKFGRIDAIRFLAGPHRGQEIVAAYHYYEILQQFRILCAYHSVKS